MSGVFDQCRKSEFLKYMCLHKEMGKGYPSSQNTSCLSMQPGAATATTSAYKSRTIFGALGIKFY